MRALACVLLIALAACSNAPDSIATAAADLSDSAAVAVSTPVQATQLIAADVVAPAAATVQAAVVEIAPPAEPEAAATAAAPQVDPRAVALIVRWEVTSRDFYSARLQGVICPGGASGPTWGIGWDGGHQTREATLGAWAQHPQAARLADTSGAVGPQACARSRAALRDVRVPLDLAETVFADAMLPAYRRATLRAYPGIEMLGPLPEGAMVSNVFNRGASMSGSRAAEKRHIRDVCVPRAETACIAAQLRASCRLWRGTGNERGLCGRREDEARMAEGQG